jgi:protoheme IX farnesyltransferase
MFFVTFPLPLAFFRSRQSRALFKTELSHRATKPANALHLKTNRSRLACYHRQRLRTKLIRAAFLRLAAMHPTSTSADPEIQVPPPAEKHLKPATIGGMHAPSPGAAETLINDLRELFKVKVVALVLVTGWGGFYLGSLQSGITSLQRGLLDTLLGIGLVSAGAGALNEALERKIDARMKRTADRPLAAGRFSLAQGIVAGLGALALGSWWLLLQTNLLTVALALLTAFTYVAIYTPLKRFTALATFIGAFPGAMGPLLGWTAARGRIEWPGMALFAILFVWQFPHFMAIAWLYRADYAKAGIRMLPVVQPDGRSTVAQALFFAILMIPVSLTPWWLGQCGLTYAVLATVLGLLYLAYTVRFASILRTEDEDESRKLARDLLKISVLYLPLLFTALMLCANRAQ